MKPRLPGLYMRGPSRKVRDSSWRAMHGEATAASEVSTATKTATMEAAATEVTATATKTATMEAATTEVTATTAKSTATMAATATSAAAVPSRRRGLTEGKQTEANYAQYAKYSFCFHILSSP